MAQTAHHGRRARAAQDRALDSAADRSEPQQGDLRCRCGVTAGAPALDAVGERADTRWHPRSRCRQRRDWRAGARFRFAVVERATNMVLGVVGLDREGHDSADLAYWIRSDHAGRGLTTEACRTLIDWGTDTLGLSRVTLWAGRDNHASRRVAVKLGFAHVGPLDWQPEGG